MATVLRNQQLLKEAESQCSLAEVIGGGVESIHLAGDHVDFEDFQRV